MKGLTFDQYQDKAQETAIYPVAKQRYIKEDGYSYEQELTWIYPALLLPSEVGELLGHLQKAFRDNHGVLPEEKKPLFVKEFGDVLWALAELARRCDIKLDDAAVGNIEKLADRARRGVLRGSGDER